MQAVVVWVSREP